MFVLREGRDAGTFYLGGLECFLDVSFCEKGLNLTFSPPYPSLFPQTNPSRPTGNEPSGLWAHGDADLDGKTDCGISMEPVESGKYLLGGL